MPLDLVLEDHDLRRLDVQEDKLVNVLEDIIEFSWGVRSTGVLRLELDTRLNKQGSNRAHIRTKGVSYQVSGNP